MAYALRWGYESRAARICCGWSRGMDWQLPESGYHCIHLTCKLLMPTLNVCMLDVLRIYGMDTLSAQVVVCVVNIPVTSGFPSQRTRNVEFRFSMCCWIVQTVEQTVELLMLWYAKMYSCVVTVISIKIQLSLALKRYCFSKTIRNLRVRYSDSVRSCLPWKEWLYTCTRGWFDCWMKQEVKYSKALSLYYWGGVGVGVAG